ncbi:MAG: BON domain-containing protein [Planctomycetia bacterium]|nr:BON domain-containing protein [Planctomycetia bacterium]
MVGFTNTVSVTFVPFFEVPPAAALPPIEVASDSEDATPNASDRAIALRVAHALAELHVPILRTLEIAVRAGNVTLRGRVRSYYERQLAHANAKRVPGVVKVIEEITIAELQYAPSFSSPSIPSRLR